MGDEPPYLTVGTEVSAKYKGAFCEAKIKKVVRTVKCKVTFKSGLGSTLLSDDNIKGTLRVGANVEARHPDKNLFIEATINKIQDCSQYTVVFDDGDITTLKRSALVLKSGRHFNESETLDQLPLTHPEHFSNPVVAGRRNVRKKSEDGDESSEEEDVPVKKGKKKTGRGDVDIGKVVCVEITDKKKNKDNWFPALVVAPNCQEKETVKIRTREEYLVRSFRDGRYYTVPKKEITDFTKEAAAKVEPSSNVLRTALEKAVQYLERNELPPHWDKDVLFANVLASGTVPDVEEEEEISEFSEESDEDILGLEKDGFVAQLYKFMEDRGTPINKVPVVCNKDLDLHKLYKIVSGRGGYNKVTNSSQWKPVTVKMGFGTMPTTSTINLVKQAYKKFLHSFEEFYRKLGCSLSLNSIPSSSTKSRSNRSIIRDRHASSSSKEVKKEEPRATSSKELKSEVEDKTKKLIVEPTVQSASAIVESETEKLESLDVDEPPRRSRSRLENRPKKDAEELPEKPYSKNFEKSPSKLQDKSPSKTPEKVSVKLSDKSTDSINKLTGKKRRLFVKNTSKEPEVPSKPADDPEPPPPAPSPVSSASISKKGVGRGKYKRKSDKESLPEAEVIPQIEEVIPDHIGSEVAVNVGNKLQVYYGPMSDGKVTLTYDAKVIDVDEQKQVFLVHYTGWNIRYDEWIPRTRISENTTLKNAFVWPSQGRGPGQTSVSDSAASSDTGSVSRESTTPKATKKKPRPTALQPSTTRSKSGITTRKRLSSEGDAISSKRKTRKRAVLSGAESGAESSDSESARLSTVNITPRCTKKTKSDYKFDLTLSETSEEVEVAPEASITEKDLQENDLNQVRCETKSFDTDVRLDLSPKTVPLLDTNMDVYEFEDELSETPKTFTSRSPDRRDDLSAKTNDPVESQNELNVIVPESTASVEHVKIEAEAVGEPTIIGPKNTSADEVAIPELTVSVISSSCEPVLPSVEPLGPASMIPTTPTVNTQWKCSPSSGLEEVVTPPESVIQPNPPLVTVDVDPVIPAPETESPKAVSSVPPLLPSIEEISSPPASTTVATLTSTQIPLTSLTVLKSTDARTVEMGDSITASEEIEEKSETKSHGLMNESSPIGSPSEVDSKITRISEIPSQHPEASKSGGKLTSTTLEDNPAKLAPPLIAVKSNRIITGKVVSLASTSSASTTIPTSNKSVTIKKKKIMSKNMFESPVGISPVTPSGIRPVKRSSEMPSKTPLKKSKKLVSLQPSSTKIQTGVIQIPNLTSIAPLSVQPHSLSPATPLRLPFTPGTQLVGGPGAIIVAPFRPAIRPILPSARKVIVPLKNPAVVPKKINLVKPITITPKSIAVSTPGKFSSPIASKPLPIHDKFIKKNVKHPLKSIKLASPAATPASTSFPNPLIPIKPTPTLSDTKKDVQLITAIDPPVAPRGAESTNPRPAFPPKQEEKILPHIELSHVVESTVPVAVFGRAPETSEQLQVKIAPVENKPAKDIMLETRLLSSLSEEESCNSLLCAEEIPGSPPPGLGSDRFEFDDEAARHHSPIPGVYGNNELQSKAAVPLPVSFESICTKSANELEGKASVTLERHGPSLKPVLESCVGEPHQLPSSSHVLTSQSEFEDEYRKGQSNSDSGPSHCYPLPSSPDPDPAIDNSPPTTPESSTSLSSGSPRGDRRERLSPLGDNINKAQPSDTDSMDCSNKPEDVADDNSNSSDTSRRFSNNPSSPPVSRNIFSVDRNEQGGSSPPGKRKRVMRRKSPDESGRSYRGGRHSTARRIPGGNGGSDPDTGRMPPPQPPVNLGKPPRSEKFNFIPPLTDDMEPEERISLVQNCIMNLKQTYMEIKTEQMLVERRKKRLKKREREREKEILRTVSENVEQDKPDISIMR